MDNKLREDENALLDQLVKHPGFKVVQKIVSEFSEIQLKHVLSYDTLSEARMIRLGEISGMRKLLASIVSRSESEQATPSWTESKQGVPAWQTK